MDKKKHISLNEDDLLKVEQIVVDHDKEGALDFVKEVIKKQRKKETKKMHPQLILNAPAYADTSNKQFQAVKLSDFIDLLIITSF